VYSNGLWKVWKLKSRSPAELDDSSNGMVASAETLWRALEFSQHDFERKDATTQRSAAMKTLLAALAFSLLPIVAFSQASAPPNQQADQKSDTGSGDKQALSKDYLKSAMTAMSSIDDWLNKAKAAADLTGYHEGSAYSSTVFINLAAADRASDAANMAGLNVKLAKADVSNTADKDFQKRLEAYVGAVEIFNAAQVRINLHPGAISEDVVSKKAGCQTALKKALDDGTTKTFAEHPDICKPDSD
jgi:hypothetical protein